MTDREKIIREFYKVKNLGFVKSNRKNNTGIGKTFEDYIGVIENNIDEPDLFGFEIKSHREDSSSYVTLFTKSPSFPKSANQYLNRNFGTPYENNPDLNKLHTSIFGNRKNTYMGKYSFMLINDRENEVIKIGVYDINSDILLDSSVGYTYDSLREILQRKLKNLFYVTADREYRGSDEYFYFKSGEIYLSPSFDKFLDLIDQGLIMYDIRIGSYSSGRNYGKPHDHGSGFRIIESNLKLLYDYHEVI